MQSSTTPDPGYQRESNKLTVETTNESQEVYVLCFLTSNAIKGINSYLMQFLLLKLTDVNVYQTKYLVYKCFYCNLILSK